jgi:hypothetical protein
MKHTANLFPDNRLHIATSANDKKVFVDMEDSHAATHLHDTPALYELAKELIRDIELIENSVCIDRDMGRIVGTADLVETSVTDEIMYIKRLNRDGYTRFAMNRTAEPTSFVTVVLKSIEVGYVLWSAWIGRAVPQFPGDEHETQESRPFWREHALAWGNQRVQAGTELREWPWGSDDQMPKSPKTF